MMGVGPKQAEGENLSLDTRRNFHFQTVISLFGPPNVVQVEKSASKSVDVLQPWKDAFCSRNLGKFWTFHSDDFLP